MKLTYSKLVTYDSFEDRFTYLSEIKGHVGEYTFGHLRYLNQKFYASPEWKRFRRDMIIRDFGCDLGATGHEIVGERIILHHLNPIRPEDLMNMRLEILMNPENVICTRDITHNAIHYGNLEMLLPSFYERGPNDTRLW